MANDMFGDYELTDVQQAEYEKLKLAICTWDIAINSIFRLYKEHRDTKSLHHWKDYADAIKGLFRLHNIAIAKVEKSGKIIFTRHGDWNFYARRDHGSFSMGLTRYTIPSKAEKKAAFEAKVQQAEKAYLANVHKYKGLSKEDLGKTFQHTRYNGTVEHHKILGAMPRRKLPIFTYCIEEDANYYLAVDLVVQMKEASK